MHTNCRSSCGGAPGDVRTRSIGTMSHIMKDKVTTRNRPTRRTRTTPEDSVADCTTHFKMQAAAAEYSPWTYAPPDANTRAGHELSSATPPPSSSSPAASRCSQRPVPPPSRPHPRRRPRRRPRHRWPCAAMRPCSPGPPRLQRGRSASRRGTTPRSSTAPWRRRRPTGSHRAPTPSVRGSTTTSTPPATTG